MAVDATEELKKAAQQMADGEMVPGVSKLTDESSLSSAQKKEEKERTNRALLDSFEAEINSRTAYMRDNRVAQIVALKKPTKERINSGVNSGKIGVSKSIKTEKAAVEDKISKFIGAVSGKVELGQAKGSGRAPIVTTITLEQWKALSDEEKYAMVIDKDRQIIKRAQEYNAKHKDDKDFTPKPETSANLDKAKATFDLLQMMLAEASADENKPNGKQFPVVLPTSSSINFRGVQLGGKYYNKTNLIKELFDKTPGMLLTVDSNVDDPNKGTTIKLVTTTVHGSNKQNGSNMNTAAKSKKANVVIKNKEDFLKDASHIVYIFEKESTDATGSTSVPAAITVGGQQVAASFSYSKPDVIADKVETKNGETHLASGTFSVKLTVPCKEVDTKEINSILNATGETVNARKSYWGINISNATVTNVAKAESIIGTPLAAVLAEYYKGNLSVEGEGEIGALKKLSNLKNAQSVAEAEDTADQLDQ